MSVFYDHLVGLDEMHSELADFELPFRDHYELLNQADSILHNEILNVILIILPVDYHEQFLKGFNERPQDHQHLVYLRQFDPGIDEKIQETARKTKEKIKEDLKKVKKK